MQATYTEQREQLLRRAADGENVDKLIDKLEADHAANRRSEQRAGDVERARQNIAREEAQAALQKQYDAAAVSFSEAVDHADELAAVAEKAFADAVAAFDAWRAAVDAAREISTQVHHLQMQGARSMNLPMLPGTGDLSVHVVRRFGDGVFAQSLHGRLPRAS